MEPTRRTLLRAVGAAGAIGRIGERNGTRDEAEVETPGATPTPPVDEIPTDGTGDGFALVGHVPLLDGHQYVGDETFDIPRGSNGEITVAGDCVYVGSFVG